MPLNNAFSMVSCLRISYAELLLALFPLQAVNRPVKPEPKQSYSLCDLPYREQPFNLPVL